MTRRNPYSERAIRRAIKAALAAGLRVVGVRPDGTVLTEATQIRDTVANAGLTAMEMPRDAREKLGVG